VKLFTTLLIAALAALGIYAARRRIMFALKTGAVVFLVLLPIRLVFAAGSLADHIDEFVWPLFGVLIVWVVLWTVSTRYEQRKLARRNAAAQSGPRRGTAAR
jgi:CDP-diglyceride synthetase